MEWELITEDKQNVSNWSGGETRELYLSGAEECSYKDRNFDLRLSSATVEVESSVFSDLKGYTRYLMPLEGDIKISHDGGEPEILKPYDVHKFDGGSHTESEGKCKDFNVMISSKLDASVTMLGKELSEAAPVKITDVPEEEYIYSLGRCTIEMDKFYAMIKSGNLMKITGRIGDLRLAGTGPVIYIGIKKGTV